jgi:phosphohistidine phosphatase SixA
VKNKIISLLLQVLILSLFSIHSYSSEQNWKPAQEGNKVILIRHSLAPGGGDPTGFKIDDCKTQRNLNRAGINQSKKIGKLFKKNKVPIDQVLSSQWCRCKDTAKYAFKSYKEFTALNSTFQSQYNKNEPKQLKELYSFVKKWDGKGKNLVLVTHL